jgi:phospholipid/cholesterol/gamma-HCH transport system ATP-binding protein
VALIEFKHVKKAFGPKVVYEDLNLEVNAGEALTIIGGSGMGKSVMLKLLIGLLRTDGGVITFDGKDIQGTTEREYGPIRRRIAMLFQGAALFDSMSVRDNVAYGVREHYRLPDNEVKERVEKALSDVGLPETIDMFPSDLSQGMRKRVPVSTERINALIMETQRLYNVTSIVVTHDMASAFLISDRIAMVHKGFIIASGTVEEIKRVTDPRVKDFIDGRAPEEDDVATLLRYGG